MPNLYIIAGCNGAGKTTASFTILPEMLDCKEFVNADSIAAGISPFNPENVAFEAGRIMLQRIDDLMRAKVNFAFETTLATRSYVSLVKTAKRVIKGGHNIPLDVIERRYYRGIFNLINLYIPICDSWMVVSNKDIVPELVAKGVFEGKNVVLNSYIWDTISDQSKQNGNQ
jgi:predicted ABC-type ATPase